MSLAARLAVLPVLITITARVVAPSCATFDLATRRWDATACRSTPPGLRVTDQGASYKCLGNCITPQAVITESDGYRILTITP